jgi:hypothetical protein
MNFGCFETGCFGFGCVGAGQIGFFEFHYWGFDTGCFGVRPKVFHISLFIIRMQKPLRLIYDTFATFALICKVNSG